LHLVVGNTGGSFVDASGPFIRLKYLDKVQNNLLLLLPDSSWKRRFPFLLLLFLVLVVLWWASRQSRLVLSLALRYRTICKLGLWVVGFRLGSFRPGARTKGEGCTSIGFGATPSAF
jgi:uncharacterized membrane protein YpjA